MFNLINLTIMKTEMNTNAAYETPVMETVELVLEGAVLTDSTGGTGSGSIGGDESDGI